MHWQRQAGSPVPSDWLRVGSLAGYPGPEGGGDGGVPSTACMSAAVAPSTHAVADEGKFEVVTSTGDSRADRSDT
jgi:hypothetical protein